MGANIPRRFGPSKSVELTRGDEIPPVPINWIWYGWLAAGKIHFLAGAPGTGKTHIAMSMAATVSTGGVGGRCWPDGAFATKGNVVIWTGEDGVEDTIIPRLIAAGADLSRTFIVRRTSENGKSRPFNFGSDLDELKTEIARIGQVCLVIIDSIVQAVAGDSNSNSDVRQALEPLVELAEECRCAILGVTHVAKGSRKKDPLDRVVGSLAFGAVARVVMVTARVASSASEEGISRCVLVRVKSNIGRDDGGLLYGNVAAEITSNHGQIMSSRAEWHPEPLGGSGRDILAWAESAGAKTNESAVDRATAFLRQELSGGGRLVSEIETMAETAEISMASIKRAKQVLGIRSRKLCGDEGKSNPFVWELPPNALNDDGMIGSRLGAVVQDARLFSAAQPSCLAGCAPGAQFPYFQNVTLPLDQVASVGVVAPVESLAQGEVLVRRESLEPVAPDASVGSAEVQHLAVSSCPEVDGFHAPYVNDLRRRAEALATARNARESERSCHLPSFSVPDLGVRICETFLSHLDTAGKSATVNEQDGEGAQEALDELRDLAVEKTVDDLRFSAEVRGLAVDPDSLEDAVRGVLAKLR